MFYIINIRLAACPAISGFKYGRFCRTMNFKDNIQRKVTNIIGLLKLKTYFWVRIEFLTSENVFHFLKSYANEPIKKA